MSGVNRKNFTPAPMAMHLDLRAASSEKAGLTFEGEFHYEVDVLPGWSEAERHAVKYST